MFINYTVHLRGFERASMTCSCKWCAAALASVASVTDWSVIVDTACSGVATNSGQEHSINCGMKRGGHTFNCGLRRTFVCSLQQLGVYCCCVVLLANDASVDMYTCTCVLFTTAWCILLLCCVVG